ncbi:PA4642 family protein [Hydrocarboniclastica marina]|uniref:Aminopeptidase n=1 Tax=Hydrocarboniclastica marina TaxID=2259620 RepID=A0A4P7XFJ6_9ALTE|nr:PA4642 family protein [Hydrocarboniclastica marina]MAM00481.1 hypothetical protein [Alteromonadaceae bacterium]QCF24497.1 hypothetical protein soil367_00160 [Hydrocarboniclastica marina]
MAGPDKPKVLDEEWSDERVSSFLSLEPYDTSISKDYFVLERAYQSMRADDFRRFLGFFTEASRDLDSLSPGGETILDLISQHRRSVEYAEALKEFGATHNRKS